jgi:hypothetical protein
VTTVSFDGDAGHRPFKARLSGDPPREPEPAMLEPVDGRWTIPTEDGPILVSEKAAGVGCGQQAKEAT